jgi:hypothetical protein
MKRFSGREISIPYSAMIKLRQSGKLNLGMINDVAMKIADNPELAPSRRFLTKSEICLVVDNDKKN